MSRRLITAFGRLRVRERWTPQRRRVVKRYLRKRAGQLPVCVEVLECGHRIEDPGKAANYRDCGPCTPPTRVRRRC